jgi:hypothetical protein
VNGHALSFKENLAFCSEPCCDEIFHNLLLGIDRDTAARQGLEIDAMPLLVETNLHAVMNQSFPLHALAQPHIRQKVDGTLLQDPGPHSLLTVLAASTLDHNRIDSSLVQEVR